jgi:predicted Zn-dependent protease
VTSPVTRIAGYRAELAVAIFAIVVLIAYVVMIGNARPRSVSDDVAVGPASPIGVPSPPLERDVYLAPFGDFPREDADALVAHYREKFGLNVQVLASIRVPDGAVDAERGQLIAERLLDAIAANEVVATDPGAVVIGLTDVDMFIAAATWRYAYGLRSGGTHAVVSTARMDAGFATEERQHQRLRKMVTKNLGILYYGLAVSDDPRSVLYRDILGPQDLDYASEDF